MAEGRFAMPAEHSRHVRTLTAWPDRSHYPDTRELQGIEADIAAISNAIAEFETVMLFVKKKNIARARELVSKKVQIQELDINEPWIRDTGPVYVKDCDNVVVGLDLNFNYWGNKLNQTADGKVAGLILRSQGVRREQTRIVAEGGAIEVDGEGTLLMTESSILNDNRNPGVRKEDMEKQLRDLLGIKKVVWLPGIKGLDITDSHIDGAARFIAPGRLLLSKPSASSKKRPFEVYENAKTILESSSDAMGRKFQIVEIEEGDSRLFPGADPYELCLSYANYLLVNGGVVIPAFGDPVADDKAFAEMQDAFPDRKVSQVLLTTLWRHGGGIHCTTQQQPI